MSRFDFAEIQIRELRKANLLRSPVCIDSAQGTTVTIDGHEKIVFCSNNYLNLANHPRIINAVSEAIRRYGHGAGASRLVSGTMSPHLQLERAFAELFGKESALVFPSGWAANESLIKTLGGKQDLFLLDKLDHASIVDAVRASGAVFRTYRRGSYTRLEKFLTIGDYKRKFIVTESIFSMDGDEANLKTLVDVKNKYGAFLIVDEAHALGCLGERGAGLAEKLGLLDEVDIIVATMSKALGSAGGVIATDKSLIDLLINRARSFIYTTAPTVANCAAALAAVEILKQEPQRRRKLASNAQYLRDGFKQLGVDIGQTNSHIIPVIVGTEKDALTVSNRLYEMGFFVPAIRPPTVPVGTARLRVSLQSEHTKEQMDGLCEGIEKLIIDGFLPTAKH